MLCEMARMSEGLAELGVDILDRGDVGPATPGTGRDGVRLTSDDEGPRASRRPWMRHSSNPEALVGGWPRTVPR